MGESARWKGDSGAVRQHSSTPPVVFPSVGHGGNVSGTPLSLDPACLALSCLSERGGGLHVGCSSRPRLVSPFFTQLYLYMSTFPFIFLSSRSFSLHLSIFLHASSSSHLHFSFFFTSVIPSYVYFSTIFFLSSFIFTIHQIISLHASSSLSSLLVLPHFI